ncbi:MAG: SOS response-associated peptidase family protein [Desulfobacterales bacterium]
MPLCFFCAAFFQKAKGWTVLCGRFSVQEKYVNIARIFDLHADTDMDDGASSDCSRFPGDSHPVAVADQNCFRLISLKWGIRDVFRKMLINARDDRIFSSPLWRNMYTRRCAVPVTGWWEWDWEKRMHHFSLNPESSPFFLAGLHRKNEKRQEREFVILTTRARGKIRDWHERMPVCLDSSNFRLWLSDKSYGIGQAVGHLASFSFHHIFSEQSGACVFSQTRSRHHQSQTANRGSGNPHLQKTIKGFDSTARQGDANHERFQNKKDKAGLL